MKKIYLFLLLFLGVAIGAEAQQANQFTSWWGYSGTHRLSDKVSFSTLYSWRRTDFVKNWQQSLLRLGLNYHYNDKLVLTAGYDWVETYPYGEQPIAKQTREQRSFQVITVKNNIDRVKLKHRYRLEQRYSNGNFLNRFRYRFTTSFPLNKPTEDQIGWSFVVFDEAFIHLGKVNEGRYFNQNWLYGGISAKLQNGLSLKLGYMNQYLVKGDGMRVENNHTLQVGVGYNFDFRKDK